MVVVGCIDRVIGERIKRRIEWKIHRMIAKWIGRIEISSKGNGVVQVVGVVVGCK